MTGRCSAVQRRVEFDWTTADRLGFSALGVDRLTGLLSELWIVVLALLGQCSLSFNMYRDCDY